MKTTKKRLLSFLLVAVFLAQFLPFAVIAAPGGVRVYAEAVFPPGHAQAGQPATIDPGTGTVTIAVNVTIDPYAMPAGSGFGVARYFLMFDSSVFTLITPPPMAVMAGAGMMANTINQSPVIGPQGVATPTAGVYVPLLTGETAIFMVSNSMSPGQDITVPVTKTYIFEVDTNATLPDPLSIRVHFYDVTSNSFPLENRFYRRTPTVPANYATVGIVLQQHEVIFDLQGGAGTFPAQTVNHGAFATQPAATPTRANYDFVGWFAHPTTGATPFAFATTAITADTTIYARWTPTMRTVTFDPYPGTMTSMTPISVPHGGTIANDGSAPMPANPTRDGGYEFAGWWANGTEITADTPITQDWNVTARWTPPGNYVHFSLSGGGPVGSPDFEPQFVANNGTATRPNTQPVLAGHTFLGWFTHPVAGVLFNFDTIITESITLHARFTPIPSGDVGWPGPGTGGGNNWWHGGQGQMPYLTISNYPNITPNNQWPPAGRHAVQEGASVILVAGNAANWTFLGWHRGPNAPRTGDTITVSATNRHSFTMPSTNRHYVAVWGNQDGVVGVPNGVTEEVDTVHHAFLIGFEDGTVRPTGTATRAHLATILFRLMSDAERASNWSQTNSFTDVTSDDWFNNAISTVVNAGILPASMTSGTTFQPERQVTRAEVTAALIRLQGVTPVAGAASFNDIAGHWAVRYINAAAAEGWARGFEGLGGAFAPNELVTRAQMAALVNRAFGRLPQSSADLLTDMVRWTDNADASAWYYLYIQEATNSHHYEMKADGIHEAWTSLIPPRNWEVLERPTSRPGDITG